LLIFDDCHLMNNATLSTHKKIIMQMTAGGWRLAAGGSLRR
jgi:hypothetical protein